MSAYDIPGYDAWKTATPWDDEISVTVTFTCHKCDAEHEDYEATGSSRSSEVTVDCTECGTENTIDTGRD